MARAMARIPALLPDVAILDVGCPTARASRYAGTCDLPVIPPPACLMLTSYLDDEALFGAIIAGASGDPMKQVAGEALAWP